MPTATQQEDGRTPAQLIRQWTVLQTVKLQLVKQGLLNGDASPQQVIACLRAQLPVDLMTT